MSFEEAVHRIFPGAVLPSETDCDGYVELLGLPARTLPRNCEVLASGEFQYAVDEQQRSSYLVRSGQLELIIRLCPDACNSVSAQIALRKPAHGVTPFH
jgi:hypothetical protein